ncbi:MAG TPA: hypothetical protein VF223_11760 [Trebonia sp.]
MTAPMSRTEILALPPAIDLPTLGRALGVCEPVIRERARRGELEPLGIRVVRLGAQFRVVTQSLWTFLGVQPDETPSGASNEARPWPAARQRRPTGSATRLVSGDGAT